MAIKYQIPTYKPKPKVKKPKQASLFDPKPAKDVAAEYTLYSVGGWKDYSKYIDPRTVPICDHDHGLVDPEIGKRLMKHFLMPSLLYWRCLSAPWGGYPKGTSCMTYGSVGEDRQFDLWVRDSAPSHPSLEKGADPIDG